MLYHCRAAIGHYARMLGRESAKTPYPAIAVLSLLWHHAPDPYAESAVVRVSTDDLAGLIASGTRLRQILAALVRVGAVARIDRGYVLRKPPVTELDDDARLQVAASPIALGGTEAAAAARRTPAEREAAALAQKQRKQEKKRAAQRRAEVLAKWDKKPSEVRDMLAKLAKIPPNTLRYSGQGSAAVTLAIDWLANTGATWREFYRLFAAIAADRSDDRPTDLQWVFASKHEAYLQRMVAVSHTLPRTENDAHA